MSGWVEVEAEATCRRCKRTASLAASVSPQMAATEGGLKGARRVLEGRVLNRIESFACVPWVVRLDPPQPPAELPERYRALWQETEGWRHPPVRVTECRHEITFGGAGL